MTPTGVWLLGGVSTLLGLIGLILAAGAQDATIYLFGLSLFGFGILFTFGLMRRSFDLAQEDRQ
ncbi:MAG: hypothetical protein KJ904_08370 [Alphaproteobacteria bacterium]|nr:hypothetical protein [Alphaproteobacteria bacterium]MBU0797163.1 hypothetical protein [Alphaproteobacteria bacterium]MBU0887166.1 hypothetical protein [Alphaproteobacteria bacterium]MBU1814416.1 hypothetical protein [Alphaproteobacteria bacterium]MBU2089230.1 hypothetical protein [Alphaproteobacteria bacterium]